MNNPSIISVKNLSVNYENTEVFQNISFDVVKGDFIGLAGPNGAGKTTLVKAILELLPIKNGQINLFNQPQKSFKDWHKIGYLPQKSAEINSLLPASVEEVINLGLLSTKKFPKRITKDDKNKVTSILKELDIENLTNKLFSELSGGQQQKVLLARCLVANPEILIFDEPSTALDPTSRNNFFKLIQKLHTTKNITIIFITHDTGYIGQYANKLLFLDKKIVYFGSFDKFCKSENMDTYFGTHDHHLICHQH